MKICYPKIIPPQNLKLISTKLSTLNSFARSSSGRSIIRSAKPPEESQTTWDKGRAGRGGAPEVAKMLRDYDLLSLSLFLSHSAFCLSDHQPRPRDSTITDWAQISITNTIKIVTFVFVLVCVGFAGKEKLVLFWLSSTICGLTRGWGGLGGDLAK